MKNLKVIATLTFMIFITSCSKPENGINGETGTANVIYSAWLTAPAANAETIDGTTGVSTFLETPEVTADILTKGTILTYMSFSNDIFDLPYTSRAGGKINTITSIASLNKIKFFRFAHDGTTAPGLSSSLKWRYILIPGGVAATTGKQNTLDYSMMTYEEVCVHFNIRP